MRKQDYLEYCRKIKPRILKFFKKLYDLKILPEFDCGGNVIPLCLYTKKEWSFLADFASLANCDESIRAGNTTNITSFPCCFPVTEFTIDKKVVRCLPLSEFEKVDMENFQNVNEIEGYYRNKYDIFMYTVPINEKCRSCIHMQTMQCQGGCIAYRMDEINSAREMIKSMRKIDL
jgi:radical SAM protein with 4Fe4S-binding SPASM domain